MSAVRSAPPSIVSLVAALGLFAGVSPEDHEAIAALARTRKWPAGATLFQRGDEGREMVIVTEGRVRLSVPSAEGRELSLRHAGPGALLGEMAVLDGQPRSADATAVTAVTALTLARPDVDRLLAERPSLAQAVIRFLCGRLRETTDQLESIALYRLEQRLARFLLTFARAESGEGADARTVRLELGFSQSEIADMLGASRPKVNGALSALEEAGAIRRDGRALVCRMERLASVAEGDA